MPRRPDLPCAGCGKLMWRGKGVLPAGMARCRECRKALPPTATFDPAKCGTAKGRDQHRHRGEAPCEPCRLAWNEVSKERQRRARERGWQRGDRPEPKVKRRPGMCTKCGCAMQGTSVDEPMCSSCRGLRPGRHIAVTPAQRESIYDRDGWACQICLDPVDPDEDRRRRWGATLDHIVPVSQGGTDDPDNLRLAHRWCNSVRGDLRYYTDDDLRVG